MNKEDIVNNINQKMLEAGLSGVTKVHLNKIFDFFVDSLVEGISEQGKVSVFNFGTFYAQEKSARKGRNPKTGEEIEIPKRKVCKFISGKRLKDILDVDN